MVLMQSFTVTNKKAFQANFEWFHSDKKHSKGVTESEDSAEEKSLFCVARI